jgi:hypothetical protein
LAQQTTSALRHRSPSATAHPCWSSGGIEQGRS